MSAPSTEIEIYRLALDLLRQDRNNENLRICARWYDATRKALLRSHFWWFARRRRRILLRKTAITGATQADPCVITAVAHGWGSGEEVRIEDVVGMTELNGITYLTANKTTNTFEITDIEGANIDSTAFTAYTSGGLVTPYIFGYKNAYILPTDFLRLHFIGDDATRDYKKNYEIQGDENEGTRLYIENSGAVSLNISYIKNTEKVSGFDSLFVILLAAELANNISYRFDLKSITIQRLETTLIEKRIEAKAVNGQDQPPVRVQSSKFINARRKLTTLGADKFTYFD